MEYRILKMFRAFLIIALSRFLLITALDVPWTFSDAADWGKSSPACNGEYQSPIELSALTLQAELPPLQIAFKAVPFIKPLIIQNARKSVNVEIPPTFNGQPLLSGGLLKSSYEAYNIHFHWGSPNSSSGSEHLIENELYDMEMHIVHKNIRYDSIDEALLHSDGLAVLAFMFKVQDNRPVGTFNPMLDAIFDAVAHIQTYGSEATLMGIFKYHDFIRNFDLSRYYTYFGSLTTPPCSQAVQWHVFPDPLYITTEQINNFYQLMDENCEPVLDNIRPVQPLNGREVLQSTGYSSLLGSDSEFYKLFRLK